MADRLLVEYTQSFPEDVRGWEALGGIRRQLDDYAGAENAFRKALLLNPDSPDDRWLLATSIAIQGRASEAQDLVEEFFQAGFDWLGHIGRAWLAADQGRWDEVRTQARAVDAGMPPGQERWLQELGGIVLDVPGEHEWAEELLRRGIASDNAPSPTALIMYALLLEEREAPDASESMAEARSRWPASPGDFDRWAKRLRATIHRGFTEQGCNQGQVGSE
jgi:tetratricopeptide (TPR) repeat protein